MIGRLMRDKGVYDFLEAAQIVRERHPQTRFRILGRPETSNQTGIAAAEVERLSTEYGVEFLPETRDVRPVLAACSVFVLPSFYREGLPRTILEAMATGRPIITTDMPGCRDAIEPGENGLLVAPRWPGMLADAMNRLIENPDELARMAARSRQIAERTYDVRLVNHILLDNMGLLAPFPAECAPRPQMEPVAT
jgi:glycosyltransferase involved in cell wall biosynthesis